MTGFMDFYELLPQTNCKECGEATCMAFAAKLTSREVELEQCTPLFEEQYKSNLEKLQEMIAPLKDATETGLIIHEELCTGCGNCVVACPVNVANDPHGTAIGKGPTSEKVILRVINGKVHAFNVQECRRFGENRILCYACIDPCPTKAIEFV